MRFESNKMLWPVIALVTVFLAMNGCSSTSPSRAAASHDEEILARRETTPGGAELWAQRCGQCHYARDASYFSPAQWEIIMFHMRVRANLTAEEHQEILEFIKSSN